MIFEYVGFVDLKQRPTCSTSPQVPANHIIPLHPLDCFRLSIWFVRTRCKYKHRANPEQRWI